jgi:LSD1 subclass zinc finger protein
MPFFQRAAAALKRLFRGCYGGDQLSMAMTYASLALILFGALPHMEVLLAIAYALVILSFARMFSRNSAARRKENEWFLRKTAPLVTRFFQARARFKNRRLYAYFRCPGCRSWLKLPRGAGKVTVTCGKCGRQSNKSA